MFFKLLQESSRSALAVARGILLKALRKARASGSTPTQYYGDGDLAALNHAVLEAHALITAGNLVQADQRIARLVVARPHDPDLQYLLGLIALKRGENTAAVAQFESAIALRPSFGAAHIQLAQLYGSMSEPGKAQACYEAAIRLMPQLAMPYNGLGLIHLNQKRLSDAEGCFLTALRIEPGLAAAQNNLGRVYSARKQYDGALACYRKAIDLDPGDIHARINLGLTLNQLGEDEQALAILLDCHSEIPNQPAVIRGLGAASFSLGRLLQAEQYYRESLTLNRDDANAHFALANIELLRGDLAAGWEQYEWRTRLPEYAGNYNTVGSRWHGESLNGKLLLVEAEQGYGDILLFARFLPSLRQLGAHVIFRCGRALVRLLENCSLANRVIEAGEPVAADYSIPLLSLGRMLKIGPADVPGAVPYLSAPANLAATWRGKVGSDGRFRIGLAWGGNPSRAHEHGRVPPTEDYRALAGLPGVAFYNLQLDCEAEDIARFPLPLIDLTPGVGDFADTAALVENLDLIISVDTSVAHLCGAMGKPTWVLHSGVPDWRWEIDGRETPWYPTGRLFRRVDGRWAHALAAIAVALGERASGPRAHR